MEEKYQKLLEEFRETVFATALCAYLDEQIDRMTDINSLTIDNLKARQDACKIMESVFKFLDYKTKKVSKSKYN